MRLFHILATSLISLAFIPNAAQAAPPLHDFCVKYEGWAVQLFSEYVAGATRWDLVNRHVLGKGFSLRSWHGWTIDNLAGSAERMGRANLMRLSEYDIRANAQAACTQVWTTFSAMERH